MKPKLKVLNSAGEQILLNSQEQHIANTNQKLVNALGFEIDITTLTTIQKKISDQKFFEIAPADYLPVKVGDGAWSSAIVTYRSFATGGDFSQGVLDMGGNNGRLAMADAALDSVTVIVKNWAKSIGWTLMELQQAQRNNQWDLIEAKEKSRKKNWDLGIQQVAFLGLSGTPGILGLLNQAGVTINNTVIPVPIKTMTTVQFKTFTGAIIEAYRAQVFRTVFPTHFFIPESDYNGLATTSSPDFPIKSVLDLLTETLQTVTRNKNFKILPLAYANAAVSGLAKDRYVLMNYDEESIRMDIPVDYTNTVANTVDGFSYQNVGYGQFTGVGLYRPLELMYFDLP